MPAKYFMEEKDASYAKLRQQTETLFGQLLLEFLGSLALAAVFWATWSFALIGVLVTALLVAVLLYATYSGAGGYLNPSFVLGTLIAQVDRRLGFKGTRTRRPFRVIAYWIVQFLGSFLGLLIAIFISGGVILPTPILGGWLVRSYLSELFVCIVYNVVFLLATDPVFSYVRRAYVGKNGSPRSVKNTKSINSFAFLAIGLAHFALAITVGQITGGALNPMLSGNSNFLRAIWTLSWPNAVQGFLFWSIAVIAPIVAGLIVYVLRRLILREVRHNNRRRRKRKAQQ